MNFDCQGIPYMEYILIHKIAPVQWNTISIPTVQTGPKYLVHAPAGGEWSQAAVLRVLHGQAAPAAPGSPPEGEIPRPNPDLLNQNQISSLICVSTNFLGDSYVGLSLRITQLRYDFCDDCEICGLSNLIPATVPCCALD